MLFEGVARFAGKSCFALLLDTINTMILTPFTWTKFLPLWYWNFVIKTDPVVSIEIWVIGILEVFIVAGMVGGPTIRKIIVKELKQVSKKF